MLGDSSGAHRNSDWSWEQPVQVTLIRTILAQVVMQIQCLQDRHGTISSNAREYWLPIYEEPK